MTWIQTVSGVAFDLLNPTPDMIRLSDIAHALSRIPRFNGHTPVPYSVAQHSVHVSTLAGMIDGPQGALDGLFHDAAEAYIGDMPSPVKALCPQFAMIEARIWRVIADRYGLRTALGGAAGQADRTLLATEAARFFPQHERPRDWGLTVAPVAGVLDGIWFADTARDRFIERAAELGVKE